MLSRWSLETSVFPKEGRSYFRTQGCVCLKNMAWVILGLDVGKCQKQRISNDCLGIERKKEVKNSGWMMMSEQTCTQLVSTLSKRTKSKQMAKMREGEKQKKGGTLLYVLKIQTGLVCSVCCFKSMETASNSWNDDKCIICANMHRFRP